ncbi:NUDIX hydrolase [Tessaracoccus caeni]|uniref:NUDIX hydrolase n=1 Tax=Tessaracoccus caeni TaxID=3031239 RepID=UPI0023D99636|nr:histidine phosphatase family protein [Tessaracoccus caeni]MDF1487767.1 NUDIX domain-containing protein [Tessaracoccus caeni]
MSKKIAVRGAGAVVLREVQGETQALVVYRKRYNDWSLPKGKGIVDEQRPITAVREVREETGVIARLDLRLPSATYQVAKGLKRVDYWRATPAAAHLRPPDREVTKVRWLPVEEAIAQMTYQHDIDVLTSALTAPATTPLLLVRHAKAMLRKNWSGSDQTRRLASRGRRQAADLIGLLEAFGVSRVVSSPATRCYETMRPFAKHTGLEIETAPILTEEEGANNHPAVRKYVNKLAHSITEPTALCGHRPVLPAMFKGLDLDPRPMVVAEVIVLHRDADGNNVRVEIHKPTA